MFINKSQLIKTTLTVSGFLIGGGILSKTYGESFMATKKRRSSTESQETTSAEVSSPESYRMKLSEMKNKYQKPVELKDFPAERNKEKLEFPDTLEGFGYHFDKDGVMKDIKTGNEFEFNIREGDHHYNQVRYEAIGDVLTDHIYHLLETETGLKRHPVPIDAKSDEPSTFFFASDDAFENEKVMIFIHGNGVVRAGQWARRLIINDCLDSGTQLPFIKRAQKNGYGIIVLNTNDNDVLVGDEAVPIRGSSCPLEHGMYVWDNYISKLKAKHIGIVAHSFGGVVTVNLLINRPESLKKVFAVALTDSVHSLEHQQAAPEVVTFFKSNVQNWISSEKELDSPVRSRSRYDCPCVSAGHRKHEMTSWSSFESVFKFLEDKYKEKTEKGKL